MKIQNYKKVKANIEKIIEEISHSIVDGFLSTYKQIPIFEFREVISLVSNVYFLYAFAFVSF